MKKKNTTKKNQRTHVVVLLDRSGSMESCKSETISGFNGYIAQMSGNKDTIFSLFQFSSLGCDETFSRKESSQVDKLTRESYTCAGNTPLYDAIGSTIEKLSDEGSKNKVLFVTLTDGQENCSSKYNLHSIRELIKKMESDHAWTFAHIGMGIDGWSAMRDVSYGTQSASNVMKTSNDPDDVLATYMSLHSATTMLRRTAGGQCVNSIWTSEPKAKKK